jgi:hypothetical protein
VGNIVKRIATMKLTFWAIFENHTNILRKMPLTNTFYKLAISKIEKFSEYLPVSSNLQNAEEHEIFLYDVDLVGSSLGSFCL